MVRRWMAAAMLAVLVVAGSTATAGAAPADVRPTTEDLIWARRYNWFVYGSSQNPLDNATCGRVVQGVYLLPPTLDFTTPIHCTVPHGMPIVSSIAGAISWAPTDGDTPAELFEVRDELFSSLSGPRATLDGHPVPFRLVRSFAHPMQLQPGNFLQGFDPAVPGTSTQVASVDWMVWFRDLTPGRHTIVTGSVFAGEFYPTTYDLTIQ